MTENANEFKRIESAARTRKIAVRSVTYLLLTVWALLVLFPFFWMVLSSIKSYSSYNSEYVPRFYATDPTFENYTNAFEAVPLWKYLGNTLLFTVGTTAIMLVVTILAAFAFSRSIVQLLISPVFLAMSCCMPSAAQLMSQFS